jgi:four helix bundle protein
MASTADLLAQRTKQFATRIVKFARRLPIEGTAQDIGRQLVRAATSESANYQAARRGRSRAEFIAKLGIVAEEADETEHWLQLVAEANLVTTPAALDELGWLRGEAAELRAIFVQSVKTARKNYNRARGQMPDR